MKTQSFILPQFVETKLLDNFPKVSMKNYNQELPENFVTHTFYRTNSKSTDIFTVDGFVENGCFDVYTCKQVTEKTS